MAKAVDALNGGNWQRAGSPGTAPPPVPRPADKRAASIKTIKEQAAAARWLKAQADRETKGGEE